MQFTGTKFSHQKPVVLSAIIAFLIVTVFIVAISYCSFKYHPIGDWGVESDFYWDQAPAAEELLQGKLNVEHYRFKGPGYPLLLTPFIAVLKDSFLAARILALTSTVVCLLLTFLLFRKYFNPLWGTWAVLALVTNCTFARYSFRAGTDMPFFMLCLIFYLVIVSNFRGKALIIGLLSGFACLIRYNGISLVIVGLIWAAYFEKGIDKKEYFRKLISTGLGLLAVILPWCNFLYSQTGDPFCNLNFQNIAYELSRDSVATWDQFWYSDSSMRASSLMDVIQVHGWGIFVMIGRNLVKHFLLDMTNLLCFVVGLSVIFGIILYIFKKTISCRIHWLIGTGIAIYCIISLVYYSERFSMPLLPIYLIFSCLFFTSPLVTKYLSRINIRFNVIYLFALVLILLGAPSRMNYLVTEMKIVPTEILDVAKNETFNSLPHGKMTARKPHAPYLLGHKFVVLPIFKNINLLADWLEENNIDYLFLSRREASLRPELSGLLRYPYGHPRIEPIALLENENSCGIWRLVERE
ncbi:MAG: glycosyltransferase family 39 protein [Calditrichaeota bacterium]|nr:glycosyltransferase family 39 protein [Calditrichota bacterium]